ncbi:hypothetical protein RHS01_10171 [Rhizoctonia solani]|uniref:Reverse transcriptase n=1 Tax=Rhizoctonia solani TaxID=456999 RepID=A0A8H7I7K2_9AGAM|nr:hypothetical protein RHS01_10171 [Rhizoctonia solani]
MATRSRTSSRAQSPFDQGHLEPQLPPTTALELGEVSLKRVTRLLLGLLGHVKRLERDIAEIKEAGVETRTNVENISQTVDVVKDGLRSLQHPGPHTPKGPKAKANLPRGHLALPNQPQEEPLPPSAISPSISASPIPIGASAPPPPAPAAHYPAPVKVDHPNAYTGKIGSKAKQWLTRMLAWTRLNAQMFPTDQEVLSFLLMNMKDAAGPGPTLTSTSSGHTGPLSKRSKGSSWTEITTLTQSGTCADYITKFRTLAMELDWNNAALRGQFARSLHWEPPPRDNKPSKTQNPARGTSTGQSTTGSKKLSDDPNFVLEEEQNRRRAAGACIKCGKMGHKFAECRTGWKATPIEDKGKAKETAKIGEDSESQSGKDNNCIEICHVSTASKTSPLFTISIQPKQAETIEVLIDSGATSSFLHPRTAELLRLPLIDLPSPRTVTMLDGSSPQAGKIWKKANLTFSFDGKLMTETFLICNTGSHAAILGLKWLDAHNPEIDWNARTLSFPHTPPEHVAIAEEEEADQNPLEGVPPNTINTPSMTDAESATLKDWLRDELKAGKIRPRWVRRLVVDYRRLNNRTKKNVYPLPCPDDLMAQLRGAKIFTKLDLRWGYNNVRDDASHTQHVHEVLRRLMENQLFCKASKCTFHVTSVEYLGIIVSDKGFSLDQLKIKAVQDWPTPTKVKEVQSFLGFANFLRRFVANFSHMARPLHNLVKKDTVWKWESKEQEAFQGLKDAITNAPVLRHADPAKPYFLETDASGAALGSILSQRQEDGCLHPLGFLSESFKGAEQNYDTHDKELLAIIRSFEYWRIFLEGTLHPITVFTDHRNLEYWKESRTFNRRHARWHLLLAGYNFQIIYRPGKQSGKPDALSRRSDHADIPPDNQTMLPEPIFANVALVTPEKELQRQIEASLDQDESLEEILQFLQNDSKAPPYIKRAFKDYQMEAGLLFYQGRIVVPDVGSLRTDLLRVFHDSPLAGHPGRQRTLELISRNYYWPGIRADTYWHVDSCETCQRIRKPKYTPIPPQPLELPSRPWQHVSYNMIVDLPKDGSNDSILVIVDSFTKYGIFVKCSKKLKAPELAELFLDHVWKRHGMPEKTVSDRGRVFNNKFLKALYKRLGIDPHFSSAYHPQSNGQTERVNPSIEHFLRAYSGINQRDGPSGSQWRSLRITTPSIAAQVKPPLKRCGQSGPNDGGPMEEVESALRQSKQRMVAGENGDPTEFKVGEEAWLDAKNVNLKTLSPKLTEQRLGPFKVIEKISDRAYRLDLPPTMRIHNVFYNRPPPVTIDGEEEYEVEGITDAKERDGKWFFRVKWKGYGSEENTWNPEENLKNAEKILEKYEKEMKKKALGAAKALRGGQCRRHN